MQSTIITGATHTLAKEQDEYINLATRSITIEDKWPAMQSAWKPSGEELAILNQGGEVILTILGTEHPPVMVSVE